MRDSDRTDTVEIPNIRALRIAGRALIVVEFDPKTPNAKHDTRREVVIPRSEIDSTSNVKAPGDKGKLAIPKWLAVDREFIDGDD